MSRLHRARQPLVVTCAGSNGSPQQALCLSAPDGGRWMCAGNSVRQCGNSLPLVRPARSASMGCPTGRNRNHDPQSCLLTCTSFIRNRGRRCARSIRGGASFLRRSRLAAGFGSVAVAARDRDLRARWVADARGSGVAQARHQLRGIGGWTIRFVWLAARPSIWVCSP